MKSVQHDVHRFLGVNWIFDAFVPKNIVRSHKHLCSQNAVIDPKFIVLT